MPAAWIAPEASVMVAEPGAGLANPENTYGPAPDPVTLVAGDPATVRSPAATPVTATVKVTETVGRVSTELSRLGTSAWIVGAMLKTLFCAPGVPYVPTEALQEDASELLRTGLISSREGPFPSGPVGHGGSSS